MQNQFEFLLIT